MTQSSIIVLSAVLLSAVLLAGAGAVWVGPALAQTSAETQSCGGLLCDIGVFGHRVPAPVAVAPEAPAKQAQTAAVVPPPAIRPVGVESPHKIVKKSIAKIATAKPLAKAPIMNASAPTAPRAAAAMPAKAPDIGGADAGQRPPSPADMFRPIY